MKSARDRPNRDKAKYRLIAWTIWGNATACQFWGFYTLKQTTPSLGYYWEKNKQTNQKATTVLSAIDHHFFLFWSFVFTLERQVAK